MDDNKDDIIVEDKIVEADVNAIIKSLSADLGSSNEDQGKLLQLMKGLAFSDDPKANEFMKKVNAATTKISKEMSESVEPEADTIKVEKAFTIPGTDIHLKEGQVVSVLPGKYNEGAMLFTVEKNPTKAKAYAKKLDDAGIKYDRGNGKNGTVAFEISKKDKEKVDKLKESVLKESPEMASLYQEMRSSSYFDDVEYERSYDSITAKWEGVKEIMISTPMAPDLGTTYSYSEFGSDDDEQGFNSLNDLVSQLTRSTMY